VLEHPQGPQHHLARLRGRVELAHDPDRSAGATGAKEAALQHQHAAEPEAGQVEGDRGAGDPATDDDSVRGGDHGPAPGPPGRGCARAHPTAAETMGINIALYKALVFEVSAAYAGAAVGQRPDCGSGPARSPPPPPAAPRLPPTTREAETRPPPSG